MSFNKDYYDASIASDESDYEITGNGSLNHPSIDRDLYELSLPRHNSVLLHTPREFDQPMPREVGWSSEINNNSAPVKPTDDRSWFSEPCPTKMDYSETPRMTQSPVGSSRISHESLMADILDNTNYITLEELDEHKRQRQRASAELFADYPSRTRLRLRRSLCNTKRYLQPSQTPLSQHSSLSVDGLDESSISSLRRPRKGDRSLTKERDMMKEVDEKCQHIKASLEDRIKMLEHEFQMAKQELDESKENLEQLRRISRRVDRETQTSAVDELPIGREEKIKMDQELEEARAIKKVFENLGLEDVTDLEKMVTMWKSKARMLDEMQEYATRVDKVIWDTPCFALSDVCDVQRPLKTHTGKVCKHHHEKYEQALRVAEQERTRAISYPENSPERLRATMERLKQWSEIVRQIV
ncbi:hypothetical protein EC973_001447 [Apophysomyces ossiformis]|uniref:Uncharacterized protein n=1 Tax=Apophysomyces ossiformis TaxID=679940 RepID=A0A8H7BJJ8_9FUNG|nr:hypothetical protein EC973_001447 [Apophysomyces ossiformis]